MLYNKNKVSKTNDKKILHKVGKQWKVVSVALLMAVAGGALATHAANADSVNGVNTDPYAANQAYYNPTVKPATQKQSAASSANSSYGYYPNESGSAAYYFDQFDQQSASAASKYSLVNTYVQSLNAEYNPQVQSYSAKSASASDAANKDAKLAASYSATNNKPATKSVIASLAAKNHVVSPDLYVGMVEGQEKALSGAVASASANVKAVNDVQSLATKLADTDFDTASLDASASAVLAKSGSVAASANLAAVGAKYGDGNTTAASFVNAANKLSAGVPTLNAADNDEIATADMDQISDPAVSAASLTSDLASDASYAFSVVSASISNTTSTAISTNDPELLTNLANGFFNNSGNDNIGNYLDYPHAFVPTYHATGSSSASNSNSYKQAVYATVNPSLAGTLASVVSTLYGKYNPEYATSSAFAMQKSAAEQSAKNQSLAASYSYAFAAANSAVVSTASDLAANPAMAKDWIKNGAVNSLGSYFGALSETSEKSSSAYSYSVSSYGDFVGANGLNLSKVLGDGKAKGAIVPSTTTKLSDWYNDLSSAANNTAYSKDKASLTSALDHFNYLFAKSNATSGLYFAGVGASEYNVETAPASYGENDSTFDVDAALLSDGVNMDQLLSESGAIQNVLSYAANYKATSAVQSLSDSKAEDVAALSLAASSANSALGSAQNASASNSTANDDDVTLSSYFASSYSDDANAESALSTNTSAALNKFFQTMAYDNTFTVADEAYAGAQAAAANDKKMGVAYAKVVYNKSAHFLDVLKGAKLHASYNFGSKDDKVLGSVNKGDRLTVLGVNFNRNGKMHGATRYLVLDNTNHKKGFFTAQPQYSKAAYLSATADHINVAVKLLKPVTVFNQLDGGKAVKTLKAGTVVNGVTVVRDNPDNDAMGFTKVETAEPEDDFFTANTDYVEVVTPQANNNTSDYAFNLSNINLAKAYNNDSQY